ncbi:aromatic ring-hydroxylating dioxygenase subunit alpha [Paraburkholderia phymatum]|uniref:aromatic ring-hydroxylating oxygenase subunit alpha n=1 Tax=Paraburkholderia phymatum TaxID=148447 RepID=UPI003177FF44
MIKPVLPPVCYTEQGWFDREQEKIFGKLWLLAGLTQQLQAENDFIVRNFSGVPVLIQNAGGTLRAFRNACAHRGMPIQIADCGNRRLTCPYHGWSYNGDGQLRGIPNEKIYGLCKKEQANLKLHSYAVETVGNFVFVNLSDDPLPITEQFSDDLLLLLREVSPHFAPEVSYSTFTGHYNWKLNFENILDWNHAQFVHKQTLAPLLQFESGGGFSAASKNVSILFGPDSPLSDIRFTGELPPADPIGLKDISVIGRSSMPYTQRWFAKLFDAPLDPGSFFACNIFPNVNFGSIHGEHFYLQQFVPMAPDRVEYHSWVFTARLKHGVPPQPHLLWGIHHAEKRVIDEDVVLLNGLQKSLSVASTVGTMGDHEEPLAVVGRWYMEHLQEEGLS